MEVTSAVVYYVLPALLGRAFDLKNSSVGPDLFKVEDTQNAKVIQRYMTTCEYKIVSELSEATDFLQVNGQLAVNLKAGNVNVEGTGSYLKDTTNFERRVDILVMVHYETVILTLPEEIKPMPNWAATLKGTGNTHYVRSIVYGGDLIASMQYKCKNEKDKETIKGALTGSLSSDSGSFSAGLKGNLEKVHEKIGDTASLDINYYATVPLGEDFPRSIEGLLQQVDKFPEQAKAVNEGKGVPLRIEVFSLEGLDKDRTTYYQTQALQDQMTVLGEMDSDIKLAKQRLSDWLQTLPPNLPEEQNNKIGEFATKLDSIALEIAKVIGNLDLSADAAGDQFKPAFEAYQGEREEMIPDMYVKDLSKLKKEVYDGTPSLEADYGGAHYTHWGLDTCPDENTKLVFSGLMSTTDHTSIGSSQYTCLPTEQKDEEGEGEENPEDIEDYPQVQQVAFVSRKTGAERKKKTVKCASCRVPGKSTTTMLTGKSKCPSGWTELYKGVLVSNDYQQVRGELVCLDTSQSLEDVSINSEELTVVTEVSPKCGSYPCKGGLSANTALPCVVCSITKKTESSSDVLDL